MGYGEHMDALADLLDGARARSAPFCQAVLEPPWALRIADHSPLALATALQGHTWVVPDDGEPQLMNTGDVAIIKGPDPYTVGDHPTTPPDIVVHAGNRLTTVDGDVDVTEALRLGPRTSGEHPDGPTIVASGTYALVGDVPARLLNALPTVLVVREPELRGSVLDLLAAEIARDEPGQQLVLDRLLDLALIATLRAWFARPEAQPPGWYRAQGDPVVGAALRLIHDNPTQQWSVGGLATKAGSSRATFARRFAELVGEPPMSYLTNWRITLAADRMRQSDDTIESIAHHVGYANAFALSVAFKRVRGISPSQHRAASETADH